MIVFLNGRFVPKDQAVVSVFDRGFLYGDGVFETMRIFNGRPFRWQQHCDRLQRGLEFLKIALPYSAGQIREFIGLLAAQNAMPDSLLRLTVSRGVGRRGYSPAGADSPSVVLSLHPAPATEPGNPPRWKLITSSIRLSAGEPLAHFKTCAKIPQILARAEADSAGADEALLLNNEGFVVEASSSNLFWLQDGVVCTSPLPSGVLPGVTRAVVLELCAKLGLTTREINIVPKELGWAEGVFLSLSSMGVVECETLDASPLRRSSLGQMVFRAYSDLLKSETSAETD